MQNTKLIGHKAKTLEDFTREIIQRGNDVEIRKGKDGIKVFEVKKKLIALVAAD